LRQVVARRPIRFRSTVRQHAAGIGLFAKANPFPQSAPNDGKQQLLACAGTAYDIVGRDRPQKPGKYIRLDNPSAIIV
jgi:hypothetical protein